MSILLNNTVLGLLFGIIGTTLGGILGAFIHTKSNRFLGFILQFAAGLMTAIVCFELIPESLKMSNVFYTILGIVIGIIIMVFCNKFVSKKAGKEKNRLMKMGIIIGIGLAIHNFPEG